MAFVHGRSLFVSIDGDDISAFCNSVTFTRTADSHDTTTYGATAKDYTGGLLDGTANISGIYDDTAAGPRAVIEPLIGTTVALVHRPEGTGSGRPQDTVDVVVTSFEESSPVAEMITWTAELQMAGPVATIDQA